MNKMNNMKEVTKKCPKCGRVLPITEFAKSSWSKDGAGYYCKECFNQSQRDARVHKVFGPEMIKLFTDKELFEELKARGYSGDLVKKLSL